ncbi:MAG TPA: glycoside hydrolase family 2 TIM barrel-domain containing protein [Bacteroidales bacterium]|nr:glycoside hydrolase family 2 TIM barrel-domain containing protein [Bacteroidales bacterium]
MKHSRNHLWLFLFLTLAISACYNPEQKKGSSVALFNDNWSFKILPNEKFPVSDTTWQQVQLPHTTRFEPMVVNDQWQGICRYRKSFHVPNAIKGKQIFLKFEGAMNVAEVYLNGRKITTHLGGFLPFVVDLTDHLQYGSVNSIELKLDNTDNPETGPKPLNKLDFNTYGGLYRDVYLIVKNSLFISDPMEADEPAGGGIFVTFPGVNNQLATISIQTHIINNGAKTRNFTIKQTLFRDTVEVVSNSSEEYLIEPDTAIHYPLILQVEQPDLWSPTEPNLYTLQTEILTADGIEDLVKTKIGIRRIEITPEAFKINGEKMFLRGVNRHQEYPYIGYALSNSAQYRDAVKIKEAGFDYVRLSHYPMSPAFMDACDELGLLVLDAIPGWQYFSEDSLFQSYSWSTCRDMIRRDRNHPCILAWEVSLNESWMTEAFIDSAVAIAHAEYPGDQCYTVGWQKHGYDIYLQARQHRIEHYEKPEKPYIVSEYGDWEYYALNAGLNQDAWGDLQEEERTSRQLLGNGEKRLLQQALNIQEAHNDNFNTPAFADGYWVMYDYNRGYTDDLEASGIMSINRLPKFSYYFFRSQRDANISSDLYHAGPMVFIASYWKPDSDKNVRIFSNCEEVELYLNGRLINRKKPDKGKYCENLAHPPFTFQIPEFEAGTLEAKGLIGGKVVAMHKVSTPGEPARLLLEVDVSKNVPVAGRNDALFVYATLLDENGTRCPLNDIPVDFTISGNAKIITEGPVPTEAGIATALIQIGYSTGKITIHASSQGLTAAKLSFESVRPERDK